MSGPPFTLTGFDHVVYLVDDMAKALAFYQGVPGYCYPALGIEQLWCGAALIVPWDTTHPEAGAAVPPAPGGRNVDHLRIATSPINPTSKRAHLAAHGVTIVHKATHGGARGIGHSF